MQRLRTEHHVDVRRTRANRVALLTRDATADTDQETRLRRLQRFPAPELRKHFLLRLLTHRARVQQQDIGVLRRSYRHETESLAQEIEHPRGVVLVHLTALCLDEDLTGG